LQALFDIAGDLDTPVSAFMKLAAFAPRFLLESVEGGERLGRYSSSASAMTPWRCVSMAAALPSVRGGSRAGQWRGTARRLARRARRGT
jgi:hypothetical protein